MVNCTSLFKSERTQLGAKMGQTMEVKATDMGLYVEDATGGLSREPTF